MSLKDLLAEKQKDIADKWVQAVNGTYPFGTIGFLRTKSDPFINPVGQRNKETARAFVSSFLDDEPDAEELSKVIGEFVKVRAIQDFTPEDAVGIILALKPIISETLGDRLTAYVREHGLKEYQLLEGHIDALALLAFGAYARCQSKVADMRVDEFKRRHSQIIRQAERLMNKEFPEHRLK